MERVADALATAPLVDVVVLLVVVGAIIGALRRGAGPLAAIGAGLGTVVAAWLVVVVVAAWAPGPLAGAADHSALLRAVPAPHQALTEVGALVHRLGGGEPPAHPRP